MEGTCRPPIESIEEAQDLLWICSGCFSSESHGHPPKGQASHVDELHNGDETLMPRITYGIDVLAAVSDGLIRNESWPLSGAEV